MMAEGGATSMDISQSLFKMFLNVKRFFFF